MSKLVKAVLPVAMLLSTSFAYADANNFKRWAVSAGWLHVMPQGKANSTQINTAVTEGGNYAVGSLKGKDFLSANNLEEIRNKTYVSKLAVDRIQKGTDKDPEFIVPSLYTNGAFADVYGISNWSNNAGLEADDVDTLGLTLSYFVNDKVSVELIGGIPPKVDIQGKGQIVASAHSIANSTAALPSNINGLDITKDILITDLGAHGKVAEVTAWTPALTAKYHFGQSGVNKFRPFVGGGIVYGHFNKLKLDSGVDQDLVNAGHMVQNVLDGQAGVALQNTGSSSANPVVNVDTDDAFAPVVTAGFSYDVTDRWFTTASVTYMPNFNNTATITVTDQNTGKELIHAKTKVDLDPLITYVGVGYRF
ncbi:OmpW family protein [Acinetobacter defluvii]|uniref:OmpW family protein n=1 Tax=Acinetobacter defluvii TaxID=1871111 RepID=A0A2S2FBW1_9GAMM|nr:OmpW family outer membrane protein [Acinetobacter defluvii]AWL28467.1 OmpW family protein [Acinetobacter defluvii]